ncbi:MAG: bifunctional 5,10-methylenetetrahydrofolate dehydrogenase/5,10-methenyltetrahydrofolate cyclohydrolase [Candidatus Zambryskibacteria bacterium]|nr:bifunctional 5,10-methylenetetrahydrofolate dehydrogenase/5,10-methenyltetrahydrofolate cyclohydrolase [Candidatus Zambryskibacteria bacterium]
MTIINGKIIAQKVLADIKGNPANKNISIAAVSVSNSLAIKSFIEMKKKYAESVGMKLYEYNFKPGTPEDEIIRKLGELDKDNNITGIIVEIPLAPGYNTEKLLNAVPIEKDIDALSVIAQENFYNDDFRVSGHTPTLVPPAVRALEILLNEHKVNLEGKTAAVFGQGVLIGKPISHWLEGRCKEVFRIDEDTNEPEKLCLQSDIVVSGVGKPNLIRGEMIKEGAVVVDFGFERFNGKSVGDVDFNTVSPKASLITPVPGGMGPIVIAAFLKNVQDLSLAR